MRRHALRYAVVVSIVMAGVLSATNSHARPLSGAIFTTVVDGTRVNAVMQLRAGVGAPDSNAQVMPEKLDEFLGSENYGRVARQFARKYADFDPTEQCTKIAERMAELARGE